MPTVDDVTSFLDRFAPAELAADWDNIGLLVGDRQRAVERVMTCLTVTPHSAAEAIRERANLIVTHHPLPFRPLRRLTTDAHEGRLLWELARAGISIYSPHTAFDSTRAGINQQLAEGIGLGEIVPLVPTESDVGTGRRGRLVRPCTLNELAERVKAFLHLELVQVVGSSGKPIESVAVACGSAGELLPAAVAADCDCLLTGEMRFHGCLEAAAHDIALVLAGHYASERFAVESLARILAEEFSGLAIWPSRDEQDPLRML